MADKEIKVHWQAIQIIFTMIQSMNNDRLMQNACLFYDNGNFLVNYMITHHNPGENWHVNLAKENIDGVNLAKLRQKLYVHVQMFPLSAPLISESALHLNHK